MAVENSVFISYRRTNVYMARAVHQNLIAHGFDVFLDYENIDSGAFDQIILNQIAARAHFVMVLTPSALERCTNPDDMVRREIEYAIDTKRNIIPLLFEGFNFSDAAKFMSDKMLLLPDYNGVEVPNAYFEEAMTRLRDRFLSKTLDTILHPAPQTDHAIVQKVIEQANTASAPSPELIKAEEYFEKGVKHHQKGNFQESIADFTRAILLNPEFVQAYSERGSAYHNNGEKSKAGADWLKAVELAPGDSLNPVRRSLYFFSIEEDYQRALEEAEEGVRQNPTDPDAYSQRGLCRVEVGDIDGGIADYEIALDLNAKDIVLFQNRGVAHMQKGDDDAAIADFKRALEINEEDVFSLLYLGLIYDNQGDYEKGIAQFDRAIQIDPKHADAYVNRGYAYHSMGEHDKAIADYDQALTLKPEDANAHNNRGFTYDAMGEYDKAIADYTRAIELSHDDALYHSNRAYTYDAMGEYEDAIADYTRAIEINPGDANTFNNRGFTYRNMGEYDKAIADYETALSLDPNFDTARDNLEAARAAKDDA